MNPKNTEEKTITTEVVDNIVEAGYYQYTAEVL